MGRLALVGGHGFHSMPLWSAAAKRRVEGERGTVDVLDTEGPVVLARHGIDSYTPAHLVDHARNLAAAQQCGCDRVLAICSVGSLHEELGVGSYLCPNDFIALGQVDAAFDDERGHVVPGFDPGWRRVVLDAWGKSSAVPIREQGVYWQSPGPRFETPAEVRLIAAQADVVGMTMAAECVAASQFGLSYAAVCVVDNLANGVGEAPLTRAEYEAGHAANRDHLEAALRGLLPMLEEAAL